MVIHRYSEYQEPPEPPFTMEDVIRQVTELMMRYHVSFNEALQYLIDQGLPINEFLRDEEMDHILDKYIEEVAAKKAEAHNKHDYPHYFRVFTKNINESLKGLLKQSPADKELNRALNEAVKAKSVSMMFNLLYSARRSKGLEGQEELGNAIRRTIDDLERLDEISAFYENHGKSFDGDNQLNHESARNVAREYEALNRLENALIKARESGDFLGIDQEEMKRVLGEKAFEEFKQAREKVLEKLSQAMESTGQVERDDDGIFKLTPAAAKKVGETALREVYTSLRADGMGGHHVFTPGEGGIEKVSTRQYEFGDSISHLDIASSMINALRREGANNNDLPMGLENEKLPIRLKTEDMEVHDTMGSASSSIAVLIDMSGSMSRFGRFYNAKKMALALDTLIRADYPEDKIHLIGFATFARPIHLSQIINLGPEQITFTGGGVNMSVDMSKVLDPKRDLAHVPKYFTNIQKALELARHTLTAGPGQNKEILLITDGAPTAYYMGQNLILNYPPSEKGYSATLREARALSEDGIGLNAFLLGSDFDTGYFGEDHFISRLMNISMGRLFHPQPDSLTQFVLVDYMTSKKKVFEI